MSLEHIFFCSFYKLRKMCIAFVFTDEKPIVGITNKQFVCVMPSINKPSKTKERIHFFLKKKVEYKQ